MIIAGIIEKAAKMKLDDFAQKYLFEPLNIKSVLCLKDSTDFCHAGGGLSMLPVDVLKIRILVMNNGKWDNKQVVSEEWIKKLTTPYFSTSFDIGKYGYFCWIREMKIKEDKTTRVISAEGAGGQKLYIFPEYKLVVAFTERNYSTPQVSPLFIKESILPVLE
jgi:CubicO group peptidase (beta-lactamase class C family)